MSWTFRVSLTDVRVAPLVGAGEQTGNAPRHGTDPATAGPADANPSHGSFWERFVDASLLHPAGGSVAQREAWQPFLHVYFDGMEKMLPLRLVQGSATAALHDSSPALSPSSTRRSMNALDVAAPSLMAVPVKDLFFSYSIDARSAADLAASLTRRTAALHVLLRRTPPDPPVDDDQPAPSPAGGPSPPRELRESGLAPDAGDREAGDVLVVASATIPLLDLAVAADNRFFFDVYTVSAAAAAAASARVQRAGRPSGCVSVSLRMEEEGEVTLQPRLLCVRGLHRTSAEYQVRYGWQRNPALALGTREKRAQASRSRESSPSRPSPHPSPVKPPASPEDDDAVERRGSRRAPSEEGCVTFKMGQLPPLQLTCSRAALAVQQLFFEVLTQPTEEDRAGTTSEPDSAGAATDTGAAVVAATGRLALRQFLVAAHHDAEVDAAFTVACDACPAAATASQPCLIEGILELRGIAHVRFELERQAATARKRDAAQRRVEASSPMPPGCPSAAHPAEMSSVLSSFIGDPLITPPQSLRSYQEHIVLVYPTQSASMPTLLSAPPLPNTLLRGPRAAADPPVKTAAAADAAQQRRLSPFDSPLPQAPVPRRPSDRNGGEANTAAESRTDAGTALGPSKASEEGAAAMEDPSTASRASQWAETPNDEARSRLGLYSPHLQEFAAVDSGPIAAATSASTASAAELAEEPSTSRAPPSTPQQPSALRLNPELSQGCSLSPTGASPVCANAGATAGLAAGGGAVSTSARGQAPPVTDVPPFMRSGNTARSSPAAPVVAAGVGSDGSSGGTTFRPAPPPQPSQQHFHGPARGEDEERRGRGPGDSLSSSQRLDRSDSQHTSVPFTPPSTARTAGTGNTTLQECLSTNGTVKPQPSAPTTQLDGAALSGASQPPSTRGRRGSRGDGSDRHRRRSSSVEPALVLHFSDAAAAAPDATELANHTASHLSRCSTNMADSIAAPRQQRDRQSDGDASGPAPERSPSHRSTGSLTPGTDVLGHPSMSVILSLLAPPPPPESPPLFDAARPPHIPHAETQQARVVAAQLSAQFRTLLRVYADKLARLASAEERARAAAAAAVQSLGTVEDPQRAGGRGNAAVLERCAQETSAKRQAAQEWQERAGALQRRLRDRQAEHQLLEARLHAKEVALASAEEELQFMLAQLVQQRQSLDEKGVAPQPADIAVKHHLSAQAAPTEQMSDLNAWEPQQSDEPVIRSPTEQPQQQLHQLQQPPPVGDAGEARQAREAAAAQRGGRGVVLAADAASSGSTHSHAAVPGSPPEHRRLFETPVSPSSRPTGRPSSASAGATHRAAPALPAHQGGAAPPDTSRAAAASSLASPLLVTTPSTRTGDAVASPPLSTPPVYARRYPVPASASVSHGAALEPPTRHSVDAAGPPYSPFARPHTSHLDATERGVPSPSASLPIASLSRIEHETLRDGIDKGDRALVLHLLHTKPQLFFADNNLLHVACAATLPDAAIVEVLLKARLELAKGVDANTGNTALHVACAARYPSAPIVKRLILAGTPVDTRNRLGLTPFHVCLLNAADTPIHRVKDTLLSVGSSSVNERTADGRTPLHLVCTADDMLPIVRYLTVRGADLWARARCVDPSTQTATDVTPMQLSRLHRAEAVARYLQQAALEDKYTYQ